MYQYTLDKTSKKFICPNCGKKTFVKYVDIRVNSYLDERFGRCDRESNCRYHLRPKQDVQIQVSYNYPILKQKSTHNNSLVVQSGRNFEQNNFILFLKQYFSDAEINSAISNYKIGTSKHWEKKGATVFWQINPQKEVVAGKVILYNPETGKRVKKPKNRIDWVHTILKLENYTLHQCLFGLHLINDSWKNEIVIVEAEKTAVIMSLFLPEYLWLATGSKGNFKREMLLPLKKLKILAYPDKSDFDDWNKRSLELQKEGFDIHCSRFIEDKNLPEGTDLADIYLESRINNNPVIRPVRLTKTEIEVNRLSKINPEIINLIKTFELLDECHNEIVISNFKTF